MVVEQLIRPKEAEKRPLLVFGLGFLYATIGLFIAMWIFRDQAGLVMVFLTTMAALPLFYSVMKYEEAKDLEVDSEKSMLKQHSKAIMVFFMAFFGMSFAFTFWYVVLPNSVAASVFGIQSQTIVTLNKGVTGNFAQLNLFSKIFLNNVEVLFFCLLFSFLYGAGAVFILAWNASVIGFAMGNFIVGAAASSGIGGYLYAAFRSMVRYLIHGAPEITGYLIGALAGGIISVAVINHDFRTKNFEKLLLDSTDLVILALAVLFFAGLIEVYITPIIFF